jgi:hypothetical protein
MSRSHRHTPVTGICCATSEKLYKRLRAKLERRKVKAAIRRGDSPAYELAPWDEWASGRDGKYVSDPREHPELLRK